MKPNKVLNLPGPSAANSVPSSSLRYMEWVDDASDVKENIEEKLGEGWEFKRMANGEVGGEREGRE